MSFTLYILEMFLFNIESCLRKSFSIEFNWIIVSKSLFNIVLVVSKLLEKEELLIRNNKNTNENFFNLQNIFYKFGIIEFKFKPFEKDLLTFKCSLSL